MTAFLSRVSRARSPSAQALNALLQPDDAGLRMDANHRLLWSLFADHADRQRDFLWREERQGEFLVLSARKPVATDLFDRVEVKPFAPVLQAGDKLAFALRANATRTRKGAVADKRVDVVMHALKQVPPGDRADLRRDIAQSEGAAWLARQGDRCGFQPIRTEVTGYNVHALPARGGRRKGQPQFGILDFQGLLEVRDPETFGRSLIAGFGRAKAFGCGLMLLRRGP